MGGRTVLGMVVAVSTAAAMVGTPAEAASRVHFDNFETGSPQGWQQSSCTVVRNSPDGGTPRNGTYMMMCNWNGTVPWNDPRVHQETVLPAKQFQREYFIRFNFRYDQNVDHKMGAKLMRVGFGSSHEITLGCQMEGGYNAEFWIYPNNLNPFYGNAAARCGDRNWHKLEIYVKHDTNGSDGIIRIWQDGVVAKEWVNVATRVPCNINFFSNWSSNPGWEHDATNNVTFDDFEVYSDLGTGAYGSMANATISMTPTNTPSQPRNLRITPP